MENLISVVVPVYNSEKYLEQCLDSIVNQTHKNIELICVDDGSTDGSLEILRRYQLEDSRIKILTQKNSYAGVARNNGMSVAQGKYIVFWDSDDFFEPSILEKMYRRAETTSADIVFCNSRGYDNQSEKYYDSKVVREHLLPDKKVFAPLDIAEYIFQITEGWAWDKFYNLTFLQEKGLFFQDTRVANDKLFVDIAYIEAQRISYLDEVLITHRSNREGSLEFTRHKWWRCSVDMLYEVKRQLVSRGVYETYRKSFCNKASWYLVWYLDTFQDFNYMKDYYMLLQNEVLEELDLLGHKEEFFYNKHVYRQLKKIQTNRIEEYLFEGLQEIRSVQQLIQQKVWRLPIEQLPKGARVILYGYGDVGKDFYTQIKSTDWCEVVAVVDQKYATFKAGVNIISVEYLKKYQFDYIVIAIRAKNVMEEVKSILISNEVPETKIKWFDLTK